jgi:hypothetical protein
MMRRRWGILTGTPTERFVNMRKLVATALTAAALLLSMLAGPAAADPSFGPGNADGAPSDAQSKCHPPGQTEDVPGCK